MQFPDQRHLGGDETRQGIEEIPTIEEIAELISRYGKDTVTYWHDVGHATTQASLGWINPPRVLDNLRGMTSGMHLQDVIPPADDHLPPGAGTFAFGELARFVTPDMPLVWELHPQATAEQILAGLPKVQQELAANV